MPIRLINSFRELIREDGELLDLTTTPQILNQICYGLGDLLHGRGYDVLGAFEPVGFSIVPLLATMENLPFMFFLDGEPSRKLTNERLLIVCGNVDMDDITFFDTVNESMNISAIVSLVDTNGKPHQPYLSLYTLEELLN